MKRFFPLIALSLLGIALCFISYYSLQRGFASEDKLSRYTGEVIYKDVVTSIRGLCLHWNRDVVR